MKILGKEYKVIFTDTNSKDLIEDNSLCFGRTDLNKATITIARGLAKDVKNEVLVHESLHALSEALDIDLTETQIIRLAEGIMAFIKDNKKFINEIIKT